MIFGFILGNGIMVSANIRLQINFHSYCFVDVKKFFPSQSLDTQDLILLYFLIKSGPGLFTPPAESHGFNRG